MNGQSFLVKVHLNDSNLVLSQGDKTEPIKFESPNIDQGYVRLELPLTQEVDNPYESAIEARINGQRFMLNYEFLTLEEPLTPIGSPPLDLSNALTGPALTCQFDLSVLADGENALEFIVYEGGAELNGEYGFLYIHEPEDVLESSVTHTFEDEDLEPWRAALIEQLEADNLQGIIDTAKLILDPNNIPFKVKSEEIEVQLPVPTSKLDKLRITELFVDPQDEKPIDPPVADPPPVSDGLPFIDMGTETVDNSQEEWVGSDPESMRYNIMYLNSDTRKIEYERSGDRGKAVNIVAFDEPNSVPGKHARVEINFAETDMQRGLYRMSIQPHRNQFAKQDWQGGQKTNLFVRKGGWRNWWTEEGQIKVSRFRIRIPEGVRLDKMPSTSISRGMDDPNSFMLWQNRSRAFSNGPDGQYGNIPVDLYLQGENLWFHAVQFQSKSFNDGTDGFPRGMRPSLGAAEPGRWANVEFIMAPGVTDGRLIILFSYENETPQVMFDKTGRFHGWAEPWFRDRWGIPERCMGTDSWFLYISTRGQGGRLQKLLDAGWGPDQLLVTEWSPLQVAQFERDEVSFDEIVNDAQNHWLPK